MKHWGVYLIKLKVFGEKLGSIAARRVAGVARSARPPVPFAVSGLVSAPNIYILQCALILDRSLRADRSVVRDTLNNCLLAQYQMSTLSPGTVRT